jgi:hypothetical protein
MCTYNYNTNFVKLINNAIVDEELRERFLADPIGTAQDFGFSEADHKELAAYEMRKLRALVEGPGASR